MNCIKCQGQLEIKECEGHVGYTCNKCNGIWLEGKYFFSLKHKYYFDDEAFIQELKSSTTKLANHECISCKEAVNLSEIKGIELEWCSSCFGVWFDKGELGKSITYHSKPKEAAWTLMDILGQIAILFAP